jgi:hypothetical protein
MTVKPKPTVTYNGATYKVRSHKTQIPDLDQMDGISAAMWLIRNTYPRGYQSDPGPNLAGLKITVR